jgi:putative transposase
MLKAYKYRLLPTEEQQKWFCGLFGACHFVYNLALEVKITAWRSAQINVSSYELMRQLTELKNNECQWLNQYPATVLQSSIWNLDTAYKSFFSGGGFPRFKNRFDKKSGQFKQNISVLPGKIRLIKIGWVEFIEHRPFPTAGIRHCVVSKTNTGKYFVSILIDDEEEFPLKPEILEDSTIGVDVGLKTFATLSSGEKIENPKFLSHDLAKLRVAQRKLSRRFKKGAKVQSKGWQKQKKAVARLQEKIANKRADFLHKTSNSIISNNDSVCVETLNVKGMMKSQRLAKAVADASWSEFIRQLEYKAEWTGKNIIKIGRFEPSSKTCSECGNVNNELTLSERTWHCQNCDADHDRDLNAAINIKKFGLQAKPSPANVGQKAKRIGCETTKL